MDANTRTLQCYNPAYGCDEQYLREDEMVEWTCCECGGNYVDDVSGDAEERMCYRCMKEEIEEEY